MSTESTACPECGKSHAEYSNETKNTIKELVATSHRQVRAQINYLRSSHAAVVSEDDVIRVAIIVQSQTFNKVMGVIIQESSPQAITHTCNVTGPVLDSVLEDLCAFCVEKGKEVH